jgi:hypothetical protein
MGANTFIGKPCKHGHDGVRYVSSKICVQCSNASCARYEAANQEKRITRNKTYEGREQRKRWKREYYFSNRSKILKQRRAYTDRNRERLNVVAAIRSRKFANLPEPTRPESTTCECCGRRRSGKALALDHCHISGLFRGWLCDLCNRGMGFFGDSIAGLMNAVRYLERAAEQQEKEHG